MKRRLEDLSSHLFHTEPLDWLVCDGKAGKGWDTTKQLMGWNDLGAKKGLQHDRGRSRGDREALKDIFEVTGPHVSLCRKGEMVKNRNTRSIFLT